MKSLLAILTLLCFTLITSADDSPADNRHELYNQVDNLYKKTVTPRGMVRYDILLKHHDKLKSLCEVIAKKQDFQTDRQALAFYINAYNLTVLKSVLDHYPLKSVMDIPGFFDEQKHTINNQSITLNDLENKIIRPYNNPRIHAALVCAAVSCPPLRNHAYRSETLDKQLADNTSRWLSDPNKNTADNNTLYLSRIFQWYASDFPSGTDHSLPVFLRSHINPDTPIGKYLQTHRDNELTIDYLEYDWALNQAPPQ